MKSRQTQVDTRNFEKVQPCSPPLVLTISSTDHFPVSPPSFSIPLLCSSSFPMNAAYSPPPVCRFYSNPDTKAAGRSSVDRRKRACLSKKKKKEEPSRSLSLSLSMVIEFLNIFSKSALNAWRREEETS